MWERDTFPPHSPMRCGAEPCPAGGQRANARRGEQCLAFIFMHALTNKFSSPAAVGSSSVGFVNLKITAGGFLCYPTLGMNFKTLPCWVALGWDYCFPWQRAVLVHAQLPLPQSGSSSIYRKCSSYCLLELWAVHGEVLLASC